VEDEEEIRKFAARALRENGYVIFETVNAEVAPEIFEREKGEFHLYLLALQHLLNGIT